MTGQASSPVEPGRAGAVRWVLLALVLTACQPTEASTGSLAREPASTAPTTAAPASTAPAGTAPATAEPASPTAVVATPSGMAAARLLEQLPVKGRAAKTGYDRDRFGPGWASEDGCEVRQRVLAAQLTQVRSDYDGCTVLSGRLDDPYVPRTILFVRGGDYAHAVDVDHVVALGDAWQKGAQQLSEQQREQFAKDPVNLLAVDPSANRQKADSDAASWLPANKAFRCSYASRQITVKARYQLWITPAEQAALRRVLASC